MAEKDTTAKDKQEVVKPDTKKEDSPPVIKEVPPIQDRWTIYFLCLHHVPTKVEPHFLGDHKILKYHFGPEAYEDYDRWMRGDKEGEFGIVRKLKDIDDQFKGNLKRFQHVRPPARP